MSAADSPVGQTPPTKPYDLEERTAQFGEAASRFWKLIPHTVITEPPSGRS